MKPRYRITIPPDSRIKELKEIGITASYAGELERFFLSSYGWYKARAKEGIEITPDGRCLYIPK